MSLLRLRLLGSSDAITTLLVRRSQNSRIHVSRAHVRRTGSRRVQATYMFLPIATQGIYVDAQ